MITITSQASLRLPGSGTARYDGADNKADVSLFWVDRPPGTGPDFHWHGSYARGRHKLPCAED